MRTPFTNYIQRPCKHAFTHLNGKKVVIPLFKGGSKQIVASYRPVSLLTIPSKIFEKLLFKLYLHLKPLLHHSQYGFRPRRSTVTQLLVMLDKIYSALENDYEINVVSTDSSEAFDKVDHGILLQKLSKYGIGGKLLKLIHSYLNGRTQTVRVNSSYSSEFVVTSGVPQGSLLGPLFLLVYINDIANCDSLIPLLFADDAKFLGLDISSMAFQDDLDRLYEWSVKNRLYFNHEKCAHVKFNGESYPLYFENNQII